MRSIITFSWEFSDPESGIVAHYLSVKADHNDDIDIPTIKVSIQIQAVPMLTPFDSEFL